MLKPLDIAAMALALAAILFSANAVYGSGAGTEPRLVIEAGSRKWIYPLGAERQIPVEGPLGTTVVAIHAHRARIASSPCENHTCVNAGSIGKAGEWTACLPNAVMIRIEGNRHEQKLDAASW